MTKGIPLLLFFIFMSLFQAAESQTIKADSLEKPICVDAVSFDIPAFFFIIFPPREAVCLDRMNTFLGPEITCTVIYMDGYKFPFNPKFPYYIIFSMYESASSNVSADIETVIPNQHGFSNMWLPTRRSLQDCNTSFP